MLSVNEHQISVSNRRLRAESWCLSVCSVTWWFQDKLQSAQFPWELQEEKKAKYWERCTVKVGQHRSVVLVLFGVWWLWFTKDSSSSRWRLLRLTSSFLRVKKSSVLLPCRGEISLKNRKLVNWWQSCSITLVLFVISSPLLERQTEVWFRLRTTNNPAETFDLQPFLIMKMFWLSFKKAPSVWKKSSSVNMWCGFFSSSDERKMFFLWLRVKYLNVWPWQLVHSSRRQDEYDFW